MVVWQKWHNGGGCGAAGAMVRMRRRELWLYVGSGAAEQFCAGMLTKKVSTSAIGIKIINQIQKSTDKQRAYYDVTKNALV